MLWFTLWVLGVWVVSVYSVGSGNMGGTRVLCGFWEYGWLACALVSVCSVGSGNMGGKRMLCGFWEYGWYACAGLACGRVHARAMSAPVGYSRPTRPSTLPHAAPGGRYPLGLMLNSAGTVGTVADSDQHRVSSYDVASGRLLEHRAVADQGVCEPFHLCPIPDLGGILVANTSGNNLLLLPADGQRPRVVLGQTGKLPAPAGPYGCGFAASGAGGRGAGAGEGHAALLPLQPGAGGGTCSRRLAPIGTNS